MEEVISRQASRSSSCVDEDEPGTAINDSFSVEEGAGKDNLVELGVDKESSDNTDDSFSNVPKVVSFSVGGGIGKDNSISVESVADNDNSFPVDVSCSFESGVDSALEGAGGKDNSLS